MQGVFLVVINQKMKKIIWGAIVSVVLLASVVGYGYISSDDIWVERVSSMSTESNTQKTYEHIFPEQVTKNDFFQGMFIQNDVAGIYPRREALVKDILVDIGDTVKEGQTLAVLFEPGVSGQAGSNIGLKSTMLNSSSKILADTKNISNARILEYDAKIQEAQANIKEKESILEQTKLNLDSKISQVKNSYDTSVDTLKNTLTLEEKVLDTLQRNLEEAKKTKTQKIIEANDNIQQKESLLNTKIQEVFTLLVPLMYIGEEQEVSYDNIRKSDFSYLFSAKNTTVLNNLISDISTFQWLWTWWDTLTRYDAINKLNNNLILALENTIISIDTPESLVNNYIAKARSYSSILISQKEIYQDAKSNVWVLEQIENEKISQIENKIAEQESKIQLIKSNNILIATDNSVQLSESDKKLRIESLNSEIAILNAGLKTLQEWRSVLVANENKQITSASNSVAIARADLNKEYVASGDYKIISPFSWVISKRDVEIWAMLSPMNEAFRVAQVDNSLSRITKQEVKFFVPENLQNQIELGQEVYFSTANESQSFVGTVYRISPEIDPDTRSITVQAKVDDSIELSNKSSIRVALKSETLSYRIPTSSIYNKDERKIVYYKKDNGKLWVQDITILSDDGEYSLISWDFDATLKVVTTPIFVK